MDYCEQVSRKINSAEIPAQLSDKFQPQNNTPVFLLQLLQTR